MFYQVFFGIVETLKFVWAPKTFKIWVPIFFKIAETLCLLPVHWDKNKFKLVLLRSKVRPFIWKFFALYNTFCSILALKILRTLYQEKQDADSLIKLLLDGTGRIFGCLVVVWMGRNFKETIPFFNQVYTLHYQLAQKNKRILIGEDNGRNEGIPSPRVSVIMFVLLVPFLPVVEHLKDRCSTRYWISGVVPGSVYHSWYGIVITALLEFEVTAIGWYLVLYGTATLVFYSVSTKFWLKWAVRENYADSMFPKNLMLYKTLAVLARAQDSIFGPSAWPILQLCLSVMHTASAVATIQSFRGVGELTQGLSLAVLFVLCTKLEHACFIGAAEFYQLSETFKQSITRRGRRNRMECVTARSLRSLRMNVGCFYFIKMGTFKTFMASVVDNTISVLITFFY
ncbi:hypothetical protein Fcan01_16049 [Folsomia candida]|uniref:Odorant receptor n=1 Tax=Folsomia candida TaxID=158441 RepID=A0A226DX97_FOLCA|nr:hypothetical protein Fcan01_16049 [Folsomia candida]